MLNRIYRGTPAVASLGYPEARAASLEEPFSSGRQKIGTKPTSAWVRPYSRSGLPRLDATGLGS